MVEKIFINIFSKLGFGDKCIMYIIRYYKSYPKNVVYPVIVTFRLKNTKTKETKTKKLRTTWHNLLSYKKGSHQRNN